MSEHVLLFVHGMGEYADGWQDPALKVLNTAFGENSSFKGKAGFLDLVNWLLSADLMRLVLNPSAEAIAEFRGKGTPAVGAPP